VAPAPATALKLALGGEKARSLLLEGQKVVPDVALRGGFRFLHPEL
jgi:NAD dependent epimerase/dehydratase family enzyme